MALYVCSRLKNYKIHFLVSRVGETCFPVEIPEIACFPLLVRHNSLDGDLLHRRFFVNLG